MIDLFFIKNLYLIYATPTISESKIYFVPGKPEENTILAITEGLRLMQARDFQSLSSNHIPIENALSYKWAFYVSQKISNSSLRCQEASERVGYVDFHLNGFANSAIEFIRNATKARSVKSRQSTDINGHLERFSSGQYHWKRFFIFNFAMIGSAPVLPDDEAYHDRIFTYVHSSNILYRGKDVFLMPAVSDLPCPLMQNMPVEM